MEFSSIRLPGTLLTCLLMGEAVSVVLGDRYSEHAGAKGWAVSLFASYFSGRLVVLLDPGWTSSTNRCSTGATVRRASRRTGCTIC